MKIHTNEPKALSEAALDELSEALRQSSTPEDFIARADAIVALPRNHLPLRFSYGPPEPLITIGTRAVDVDNAPLVHNFLGEMDRANASDARLWTYLAFATYRKYMDNRWPIASADNWKERVKRRWLLQSGSVTRGRLVRHGIARLWWVSHLTYHHHSVNDSTTLIDPYFLTKEAFKREDRLNAIFDREVGAYPNVSSAILGHAASKGDSATDNYIRGIMRYLTLINGYRDIGALDFSAVNDLIGIAALRCAQ